MQVSGQDYRHFSLNLLSTPSLCPGGLLLLRHGQDGVHPDKQGPGLRQDRALRSAGLRGKATNTDIKNHDIFIYQVFYIRFTFFAHWNYWNRNIDHGMLHMFQVNVMELSADDQVLGYGELGNFSVAGFEMVLNR